MCETPNSLANLRVLQLVEQSDGRRCWVQPKIRACTLAAPGAGLLPRWRACSPASRSRSKRPFQRAMKSGLHGVWALTAFQLSPSSSNSSIRARFTCAAGSRRDRAQLSNSLRSAALKPTPLPMLENIHDSTTDINVTALLDASVIHREPHSL